tara:strand:- start:366 stop:587 length:222 start_codon:yes stop_codon:yes gene_type:complete
MKRTPLSLKLDKLTGTPLKAMLWHLNETVNAPYITADNMRFCTDLAIYEALSLLEKESADVFAQTVAMMGGIA